MMPARAFVAWGRPSLSSQFLWILMGPLSWSWAALEWLEVKCSLITHSHTLFIWRCFISNFATDMKSSGKGCDGEGQGSCILSQSRTISLALCSTLSFILFFALYLEIPLLVTCREISPPSLSPWCLQYSCHTDSILLGWVSQGKFSYKRVSS